MVADNLFHAYAMGEHVLEKDVHAEAYAQ